MQGTESGHRKEKKPGTWDTCTSSDYCKRLMKKEYTATCSRSQDLWKYWYDSCLWQSDKSPHVGRILSLFILLHCMYFIHVPIPRSLKKDSQCFEGFSSYAGLLQPQVRVLPRSLTLQKSSLPNFQVQNTKFVGAQFRSSAGLVERRWCSKIRQSTHPTGLLLAIHSHHASKTAYPRNVYSNMRV